MTKKLRVGVLFGGRSGEHEISLLSATSILQAIDPAKYEVVPIGVTKDGRWLVSHDAEKLLAASTPLALNRVASVTKSETSRDALAPLNPLKGEIDAIGPNGKDKLDVIFPVLHGTFGEDGTIQGMFELAGIAYVGSGVLGSAACMDKDVMKRLFSAAKLRTPKHVAIYRGDWRAQPKKIVARLEKALRYPFFVKPANLGSSVGISKVHGRKELGPAMDEAAKFDRKIVVEQAVGGKEKQGKAREFEVAILGNHSPQASVVGEVVPGKEFYDYEAKYVREDNQFVIPAKLSKKQSNEIREMAIAAFQACDCTGIARVDFLLEPGGSGRTFINEINTMPGFTSISMYPKLWEASGIPYRELISRLIDLAVELHAEKQQTSYSRPS